jgi:hypothetical protein
VADSFEPNNGSPAATSIADAVTYCMRSICGTADVDWYEFTVSSGFTATITFTDALGDLDFEAYSAATVAWIDGSYGSTDMETITQTGLASGTFWVRVYGYSGATNPSYCITVNTY